MDDLQDKGKKKRLQAATESKTAQFPKKTKAKSKSKSSASEGEEGDPNVLRLARYSVMFIHAHFTHRMLNSLFRMHRDKTGWEPEEDEVYSSDGEDQDDDDEDADDELVAAHAYNKWCREHEQDAVEELYDELTKRGLRSHLEKPMEFRTIVRFYYHCG